MPKERGTVCRPIEIKQYMNVLCTTINQLLCYNSCINNIDILKFVVFIEWNFKIGSSE